MDESSQRVWHPARALGFAVLGTGLIAGIVSWAIPAGTAGGPVTAVWLHAVVPIAGAALIGVAFARAWPRRVDFGWASVRLLIYAVAFAAILQVVRLSPFEPATFALVLHVVIACAAGLLLLAGPIGRRVPAWLRQSLDLVVGVGLFLVFGAEFGLRLIAWQRPQPLFARHDEPPAVRLENFRPRPGLLRYGFPFDADGFADRPLDPATAAERVVVVGDGALLGAVPHALAPTTVAERRRADRPFVDRAVAGVGPLEYALVADRELAGEPPPRALIVAVNLADDLQDVDRRDDAWTPFAMWLDRRNVLLTAVADRLDARLTAGGDAASSTGVAADEFARREPVAADAILEAFPWIDDPRRAEPTFSPAELAARAADRVAAAHGPGAAGRFSRLGDALLEVVAAGRDRGVPVGVLLIPARDQLDDPLWERVEPPRADRALRLEPQRRLLERLRGAGVEALDVTPMLRTVAARADGVDLLFHPGDLRLTARGTAIVGDALAALSDRLLAAGERGR